MESKVRSVYQKVDLLNTNIHEAEGHLNDALKCLNAVQAAMSGLRSDIAEIQRGGISPGIDISGVSLHPTIKRLETMIGQFSRIYIQTPGQSELSIKGIIP